MKGIQVGLLVAMGALGGMLFMKWQNQRTATPLAPAVSAPAPPPAVAARPPEPAPPAIPAAEAPKPVVKPAKAPRRPAVKPKEPVEVAEAHPPARPADSQPPEAKPADPPPERAVETAVTPAKPEPPPPPPPRQVTVAAGTLLQTRINESLSSAHNLTGDTFTASLDQPLVVDGFVIAEKGARLEGRVVQSDKGGRVKGVSVISIELNQMVTSDGQRVELQTEVFQKTASSSTGKDVAKVGAAAGIGAIIGAIAGGGKGAAIGAAAGGGAGTGGVLATRGDAAQIASETRLTFRLRNAVTLTENR